MPGERWDASTASGPHPVRPPPRRPEGYDGQGGREEPEPRPRHAWLIVVACALTGVVAMAAVAALAVAARDRAESPPAVPPVARTVLTDQGGSGAVDTVTFEVTGDFEVAWSWEPTAAEGVPNGLLLQLVTPDGALVQTVTGTVMGSARGRFEGDTFQGAAPTSYRLHVVATRGEWTVEVTDTPE